MAACGAGPSSLRSSVQAAPGPFGSLVRSLAALPKAHLHLHLTGAMRHATLVELAGYHGIRLPPALTDEWPPHLSGTDERGWFRFQRLYDMARSVLRTPADLRRLLREIAEDERAEGSGWLEIQLDPDGYAARFGGITAALELVLDAAAAASAATGVGVGIIVAANRTKHPLEARTLARLAAQYAGRGVTGFGLSNDERRGPPQEFARAFRIAEQAGLLLVPHGGELVGPPSVAACLDDLHADRIGHGVRAAEDPALVKRLAAEAVTCEVCPSSNVALGVARPRPRSRCGCCSRRACRSRWAPTTRCCSARGWPPSTRSPGTRTAAPTPSWPAWPAHRCWPRSHPSHGGPGCWPPSTPGSPHRPRAQFWPNGPWCLPRAPDIASREQRGTG